MRCGLNPTQGWVETGMDFDLGMEGVQPPPNRVPQLGARPDMATRLAGNPDERRRTPRVNCRLHGRITRGRERIRARIVDISEGGLCLLSPVWLNPKQPIEIAIEIPGRETATVHVEIWHIRREKSRTSASKVWIAGAILRDADTAYAQLLEAAGGAASATRVTPPSPTPAAPEQTSAPTSASARTMNEPGSKGERTTRAEDRAGKAAPSPIDSIDSADPQVFRLRCKAKGSPRTRMLTIAAESAAAALELARQDLGSDWSVLEALEA